MKKIFYILGAALMMAVSCNKEGTGIGTSTTNVPPTPDDQVLVTFDVTCPVSGIRTKATMGDTPALSKLYIAVFSEDDGYLQNWIPATLTKNATAENGMDVTYTYKAYFPVTTNEIFHFIGDPSEEIPAFDYEQNFIRKMNTTNGEGAFWQRVKVKGGIKAKKDNAGNYILDGTNYMVDDDDANFQPMKHVVLVRNFAKIEVSSIDSNFDVLQWALVNVPTRGTIAPWNAKSEDGEVIGFDTDYVDIKNYLPESVTGTGNKKTGTFYEKLTNIDENTGAYKGYSGTLADLQEGETSYFNTAEPTKFIQKDASDNGLYMYERPLPSLLADPVQPSTRVLVQIKWNLPADTSSEDYAKINKIINAGGGAQQWYMIELLDNNGEYMPILRHICYHLSLSGLEEAGYSTSTAAFNGNVYGNVSSSLETSTLNEITVGATRIWVNSLDFTYTEAEAHDETINYTFDVNVNGTSTSNYKTTGSDPESQVIIKIVSKSAELNGEPLPSALEEEINSSGYDGGAIPIKVAAAGNEIKRSIIRVQGSYGNNRAIYREVVITVLPKQTFTSDTQVYTTAPGTSALSSDTSGQDVTVRIGLPEGLGASMFPLQVRIEAEQNSLSATTSDLPVTDAMSTFTSAESSVVGGHRNFYYIKTISYDEYYVLDSETSKYSYKPYFDCKFKTTKSSGNATRIKLSDARDPQRWNDMILDPGLTK